MAKRTAEVTPTTRISERLPPFSRFWGQDLYLVRNSRAWGTWSPQSIPPSPQDIYITVSEPFESRLDLFSYRYYQTPELWWVLAEANELFFPFEDLAVGTVLRIPSKSTLFQLGFIR